MAIANTLLGRVSATGGVLDEADPAVHITAEQSTTPALADEAGSDAQGRVYGEVSRVTVTRWRTQGRASLGVGIGAVGYRSVQGTLNAAGAPDAALLHPSPALTVGLRLGLSPRATMFADASGTVGWPPARDNGWSSAYNTRVGMEFKSARAARSFGFDRGAIAMQLDSGYRLQMKPRRGGLAIYLRGQF
ncbi:hypothetical protein V4F39_13920 [Aquincola sp. MAHUQ-54]|uniref:Autotransporter domain-containing protein n=1 Tax=Aquincola agrisoli TaxID=3119538 RepID=A0AAW9QH91_9BURK